MARSRPLRCLLGTVITSVLLAGVLVAGPDLPAHADTLVGGTLTRLAPARIADTETGVGVLRGPLGPYRSARIVVRGARGLPPTGVGSVLLSVTAKSGSTGSLTVSRTRSARPKVWTLSLQPGGPVSNLVATRYGPDGTVTVRNDSAGRTHLRVDLVGFYRSGSGRTPGGFTPVTPQRIADSRIGQGISPDGPVRTGSFSTVHVGGSAGVPADAGAALVSVSVLAPTADGELLVGPNGDDVASWPRLTYRAGSQVTTALPVPLVEGGFRLVTGPGPVHVAVDLLGYYAGGSPVRQGAYRSLPEGLLYDSRAFGAPLPPGGELVRSFAGHPLPSTRTTEPFALLTVVSPQRAGRVVITAEGSDERVVPDVEFAAGRTLTVPVLLPATALDGSRLRLRNVSSTPLDFTLHAVGYSLGPDPSRTGLAFEPPIVVDLPRGVPVAVSCPTPEFCGAIDTQGFASTFDGSGWSQPEPLPRGPALLGPASRLFDTDLSCAAAGRCVALLPGGRTAVLADGRWRALDGAAAARPGAKDRASTNGPVPNPLSFGHALACPTPDSCLALERNGAAYRLSNGRWTYAGGFVLGTEFEGFDTLSCAAPTFCVAGSTAGRVSVLHNDTWSPPERLFNDTGVVGVSCAEPERCVAVSSDGRASGLVGTSWGPRTPLGRTNLSGLSCPTVARCVVVDRGGFATAFSGVAIEAPTAVTPGTPLVAVSCAAPNACQALTETGKAVEYAAGDWDDPVPVDLPNPLAALSCSSSTSCVAVDRASQAVRFDGDDWSAPSLIDHSGLTTGVSCADPEFCVAVDDSGHALTLRGSNWSAPVRVMPGGYLSAVSCPSRTFCAAVDITGRAVTYDGAGWSDPLAIDPGGGLRTISCPTTTFCLASGVSRRAVVYDNGAWSVRGGIPTSNQIGRLSCASPTFCAAVDAFSGQAVVLTEAGWGAPSVVDPERRLRDISCPVVGRCIAIASANRLVSYRDGGWDDPGQLEFRFEIGSLAFLSCARLTLCAIADNEGRITIGRA